MWVGTGAGGGGWCGWACHDDHVISVSCRASSRPIYQHAMRFKNLIKRKPMSPPMLPSHVLPRRRSSHKTPLTYSISTTTVRQKNKKQTILLLIKHRVYRGTLLDVDNNHNHAAPRSLETMDFCHRKRSNYTLLTTTTHSPRCVLQIGTDPQACWRVCTTPSAFPPINGFLIIHP